MVKTSPQRALTNRVQEALSLTIGTGRAQKGQYNISNAARISGIPRSTLSRYTQQIAKTGSIKIQDRYAGRALEKTPTSKGLQKAYGDIVKSVYQQSGRNPKLTAAQLGTTPQNVGKMIAKLSRGDPIIKAPERLKSKIEKAISGEIDLTKGKGIMKKSKEIKGKDFKIRDYTLEPGKRLPNFKKNVKYQIIMKGKVEGQKGKKTKTTSLSKNLNSLMQSAINLMKRYKKFSATDIYIRVFSPL